MATLSTACWGAEPWAMVKVTATVGVTLNTTTGVVSEGEITYSIEYDPSYTGSQDIYNIPEPTAYVSFSNGDELSPGQSTTAILTLEFAGNGATSDGVEFTMPGSGGGEDPDPIIPTGGGNITDKYNNTFVIEGGFDSSYGGGYSGIEWWYTDIDCSDGEDAEEHRISNKYSPEMDEAPSSSGVFSTKVITLTLDSKNPKYPRYICAEVMLYNSSIPEPGVPIYIYGTINQYFAPEFSDGVKPTISIESGKLTLEEPWILSWPAAVKLNDNSPVEGYIIKLERKRGDEEFSDMGSLSNIAQTTFTYNQPLYGADIKAGDKVRFSVLAYTQFGENNQGDKYFDEATRVYSDEYVIKNNGVLYVKIGDEWEEGQVFVKTTQGWEEAEAVYAYLDDEWKELV